MSTSLHDAETEPFARPYTKHHRRVASGKHLVYVNFLFLLEYFFYVFFLGIFFFHKDWEPR